MIRNLTAIALIALVLGAAAPARALGLAPESLALPVPFGGIIEFLGAQKGIPPGGVVLSSDLSNPGDADTFIFRLSLGGSSAEVFGQINGVDVCQITVDCEIAFGTIPGPDFDVYGSVFTTPLVRFNGELGGIPAGSVTDPFFVSFEAGYVELGELIVFQDLVFPGTDLGFFTVVPEPTSAALLGLGLAALSFGGRRARGRSCGRRAPRCGWLRRPPGARGPRAARARGPRCCSPSAPSRSRAAGWR
jgi:hypothetical protein